MAASWYLLHPVILSHAVWPVAYGRSAGSFPGVACKRHCGFRRLLSLPQRPSPPLLTLRVGSCHVRNWGLWTTVWLSLLRSRSSSACQASSPRPPAQKRGPVTARLQPHERPWARATLYFLFLHWPGPSGPFWIGLVKIDISVQPLHGFRVFSLSPMRIVLVKEVDACYHSEEPHCSS